jgi:hypothetical protein
MKKEKISEGISEIAEWIYNVTKVGEDTPISDDNKHIKQFYEVLNAMQEKLAEVEDDGYFKITAIHRDDIMSQYEGSDEEEQVAEALNEIDDDTMKHIASKMADSFCDCCYWEALKNHFEYRFYDEWKKKHKELIEDGE